MMIIDFMGYARKVPPKKANLKTFFDLCNHLWSKFMQLSKDSTRIDIFNLYHDKSIKGTVRSRRTKSPGMLTKLIRIEQPLPIEMEKFWSVSTNKVSFKKIFFEWVQTNCCDDKTLYFGGFHQEDEKMHLLVSSPGKESQKELLLRCTHEEADDRIMFHLSHGVKVGKFKRIFKFSPHSRNETRATNFKRVPREKYDSR